MKRGIGIGLSMLVAFSVPATAEIRAVFVGIDRYLYSQAQVESADFKDLRGAVADTVRIKAALETAYALDLDTPAAGQCRSANPVSITLTDTCATRAAILEALDDRIKASKRGDTLLFYFAGHGSQVSDDQVFDQASGYNATLMPTDARRPGAEVPTDILDREIREVIDRATAASINVVTIFDSCHSGTATRGDVADGESRVAPPLRVRDGVLPVTRSSGPTQGGGYRVHLAAAGDGEEAREVGTSDVRAGVFTSALAQTLVAMPGATFADIAAETRLKVNEVGHPAQNPQAEGALQATLGGTGQRVPLFDAVPSNGGVLLAGGRLSGVTPGSAFALFDSTTAALKDGATPIATARVTAVEASSATLALDAAGSLPSRLVGRETAHVFGEPALLVRNAAETPAERELVGAAIAASSVARTGEPAQLSVAGRDGELQLLAADGTMIARLGRPQDPGFRQLLADELQRAARVQTLLALRTDPAAAEASFCIAHGDYDVYQCPSATTPDGPLLKPGVGFKITVINKADSPRYIYVFGIDEQNNVALLLPPNGGRDPAVAPHQPLQRSDRTVDSPGRYRFVTIATDAPINAAALEQERPGARDPGACVTALERLLCDAAAGTRDPSIPRVGRWTAMVSSAVAR